VVAAVETKLIEDARLELAPDALIAGVNAGEILAFGG